MDRAEQDPTRAAPLLAGGLADLRRRDVRRAVLRSLVRGVSGAALIIVVYALLPADSTSVAAIVLNVAVAVLLVASALWWQVRAILQAEFPALRAVEALSIAVTLLVTLFAVFYESLSASHPDAFNEPLTKTDGLYFTMTTLATVGYGDIVARTEAARLAVMVQMVFNVVVIGVTVKVIATTARHRMGAGRSA